MRANFKDQAAAPSETAGPEVTFLTVVTASPGHQHLLRGRQHPEIKMFRLKVEGEGLWENKVGSR